MRNKVLLLLFSFVCYFNYAQQDGEVQLQVDNEVVQDSRLTDPLAPARAAFYSAVVPGLGQAYNKKYWKIPVIYAAMGGGIYFYIRNDKLHTRYRNAYKRRQAGYTDDEFQATLTDDGLIEAQKFYSKNKELSLLVTGIFYILNIVDANVDAHLMQFNVNNKLSLKPNLQGQDFTNNTNLALSIKYQF